MAILRVLAAAVFHNITSLPSKYKEQIDDITQAKLSKHSRHCLKYSWIAKQMHCSANEFLNSLATVVRLPILEAARPTRDAMHTQAFQVGFKKIPQSTATTTDAPRTETLYPRKLSWLYYCVAIQLWI